MVSKQFVNKNRHLWKLIDKKSVIQHLKRDAKLLTTEMILNGT